MKWNKMDIRGHFEFRVRVIDPDYDMIVCNPNGTYLKKNREGSLITSESLVFAERLNLDEKNGLKQKLLPMTIDETRVYVKNFNNLRKSKGWEPLTFDVLAENV